ncbi:DUF2935 domain-containing protein [Dehalobacter sp. DCM]|uniref:DUF2935 domain-containing protein n=1 Tax=Dehalobacter sp. DCM TaxID=2907827 RepID=UPI0030819D9D|nr:DUF2935 domain-containing protein [Dehalobacter sp. DCM]
MQFSYGDALPLRLLDEANFWKHQEYEHTIVIREMVSNLERKYIEELKDWEHALTETHGQVIKLTETVVRYGNIQPVEDHVLRLISFCVEQSGRFIQFLFELLSLSPAVKSNPIYVSVIKHQIRESEYFVGIAQTICGQV